MNVHSWFGSDMPPPPAARPATRATRTATRLKTGDLPENWTCSCSQYRCVVTKVIEWLLSRMDTSGMDALTYPSQKEEEGEQELARGAYALGVLARFGGGYIGADGFGFGETGWVR